MSRSGDTVVSDEGATYSAQVLCLVSVDIVATLGFTLFTFDGPVFPALVPNCSREPSALGCVAAALLDILILQLVRTVLAVGAVTGVRHLISNCGLAGTSAYHFFASFYLLAKCILAFEFGDTPQEIIHGTGDNQVTVDLLMLFATVVFSTGMSWFEFILVCKYRNSFQNSTTKLELRGMRRNSRSQDNMGTWFASFYVQHPRHANRSMEPLLHPYDEYVVPPPIPDYRPGAGFAAPAQSSSSRQPPTSLPISSSART